MKSPCGYNNEQQGGYYEECYSPDQGDHTMIQTALIIHMLHMTIMLMKILKHVQENRKVTNQRLINLERNTSLLEQGLASLAAQVGELEFNMRVLATAIGSKHTPGTLPSLPEINPKGNCHALQLRSGTTYQPPQAADLGRGMREREHEPSDITPAADQTQRPAAPLRSGPPEASQPAEPESDTDAEPSPAATAPIRSAIEEQKIRRPVCQVLGSHE
ncbi:hypothetical protein SASPL_109285 [Salvia splendens]|uniref:Uncharacterized protein n=1 Tax=Salvia splendens TaxID=180675 RepID=A0A8X8YKC5_SALSN|nr:hypothetical protein SASPL_109285 [Salvia splendens]